MKLLFMKFPHAVFASLTFIVCTSSEAFEMRCPERISMQPAVVNDVPTDWHASQRSTQSYVRGVSITVGPPEQLGDLRPNIGSVKGGKSFSWTLVPDDFKSGVWLSCTYENTVALSQRLPEGLSSCRAVLTTTENGHPRLTTSCR